MSFKEWVILKDLGAIPLPNFKYKDNGVSKSANNSCPSGMRL